MSLLLKVVGSPTCALCRQQLLKENGNVMRLGVIFKRRLLLGNPLTEGLSERSKKIVGGWLLGCAGMVFGAVTLGGITRLTESGLSMVDWRLIRGMRPPLSESDWLAEFAKYQKYPEYYYMEYIHRMWGRTLALLFFIPAAGFWAKKWLSPAMKKRVVIAGGLLVFEGLLGWHMVKSGLDPSSNTTDIPRVSQYRLAAHLSAAFALYTVLLWSGLSLVLKPFDHTGIPKIRSVRNLAHCSKTAMFLAAVWGAFVAGLDAGLVYNSWPKFADRWIPEDLWTKSPLWKNFTENPTMVQFIHRDLAYLTLFFTTATWWVGRRLPLAPRAKLALNGLFLVGYVQAALGIYTLLYYVPTWLAALHQNGSMTLLGVAFWLTNELRRIPK